MESNNYFQSIDHVAQELASAQYIADRALATVVFLAHRLQKPLFLEGEPGVGKTEVGTVMAKVFNTSLIRLQCYEGLDASAALYEWNYPKQLLYIRLAEQEKKRKGKIWMKMWCERLWAASSSTRMTSSGSTRKYGRIRQSALSTWKGLIRGIRALVGGVVSLEPQNSSKE